MNVILNGESIEAGDAATIADLMARFDLPPQSILIEHNGVALNRGDWARQKLAEGDRIEFIQVAAGG